MAGRPRGFDRDDALDVAVRGFWRDGYDETTVATLTKAMGISAPSLYAAFGDKDRLFAEAAACYADSATAELERQLSHESTSDAIASILRGCMTAYTDPDTPQGCFVLTEPRLADRRRDMASRIAARIERGIAEGDVPASTDAHGTADLVLAVLGGMSTRARDGGSAGEVAAIGELALATLPLRA
ncbi:TetR/AcrR family transcriptional regulator [Agrococcus jejuensis]|uniref:DNA-binding transcriptional regulator, AcrR family n=1 Tax=Agrococcus jejuensis TaxID=399736 RepID=A0A1G8DAA5_9MICO|nr:TetR/AcrR family transcriptional regulator [Agrococcus jejuensis]SDH54494.1 DNA-binding transcriptional regulator, AcrR family [Agrococcus jejuensis]